MQQICEQEEILFCVKINGEKTTDLQKNHTQHEIHSFSSTTIMSLQEEWKNLENKNLGIQKVAVMFEELLENKGIESKKELDEFITNEIRNSFKNMIEEGHLEETTNFSMHKKISTNGLLSLYPLKKMTSKKSESEKHPEMVEFYVGIPVLKNKTQDTANIMEEIKTVFVEYSSNEKKINLAVEVFPLRNLKIPYKITQDPLKQDALPKIQSSFIKQRNQKIQTSNYITAKNYVNKKVPIVTYVTKDNKTFVVDRCRNYRYHLKSEKIERADILPIQKHATHKEKHDLTQLDHFCFLRNLGITKNICRNSQVVNEYSNIIYNSSLLKLKDNTFKISSIYLF